MATPPLSADRSLFISRAIAKKLITEFENEQMNNQTKAAMQSRAMRIMLDEYPEVRMISLAFDERDGVVSVEVL